jgi:septum formation topological specificity factor MinE
MKHWTEFLKQKTNVTRRMSKQASAIGFDIQCIELELKNATENYNEIEQKIIQTISQHYKIENDLEYDIEKAKQLAIIYNNVPIKNRVPSPKNKKK